MAGMKTCHACGEVFELNQKSLKQVFPLRIAFRGSVTAAKCPRCGNTIEAMHKGEQQTWDAIYEGEIA